MRPLPGGRELCVIPRDMQVPVAVRVLLAQTAILLHLPSGVARL